MWCDEGRAGSPVPAAEGQNVSACRSLYPLSITPSPATPTIPDSTEAKVPDTIRADEVNDRIWARGLLPGRLQNHRRTEFRKPEAERDLCQPAPRTRNA